MVLAVEAGHRNSKKEVEKFMIYTILGGLAFLSCQAWEWYTFIHEGARLDGNTFGITKQGYDHLHKVSFGSHFEWEVGDRTFGPVPFAALFFIVTGFHGFHVFSGVVINVVVYIMTVRGVFERRGHYEMIEKAGLYWHFVDLVWVFVFTFFYLI